MKKIQQKHNTQKFPTKAVKPAAKQAAKKAAKPMAIPQGRPDTPLAETPEPQTMM